MTAAVRTAPHSITGPAALRLREVTKTYGSGTTEVRALRSVTLDIPAHRFTSIVGPSGSGKSTLLHASAALEAPTSGQIFVGDSEISALDETRRTHFRRDRIGFIFQSYNLVDSLTVAQNLTLPARLAGRQVDRAYLAHLAQRVGMTDRMDHLPSQLSGGEQQRAAILRALALSPDIVFADEPTGALDLRTAREVLDLLRQLVDELGQTIVMVTHDPVAAARAQRAVVMASGAITTVLPDPTPATVAAALLTEDAR